jgi:C1A family cysteine protease
MNNYLKADVTKALAAVGQRPPLRLSAKAQAATYTFGARLKQPVKAVMPQVNLAAAAYVPTERRAALPKAAAFGSVPDVNLEPEMPAVRDQAYRGTCVAHAAVADFEHYLISNGDAERDTIDLSEQFLYWNCKKNDGEPSQEGTMLSVAMPLLVTDGCCLETTWPYNPKPIQGNEGQAPPPVNAAQDAAGRKAPGARSITPQAIPEIKDELAAGRCVAISVVVYDYCWTTPEIRNSGNITMPFPDDISNEGHAICLVGYEDLEGEPELGGGRFILRNSWDSYWGVNCEFGTGYGTMPYAYLTTYGMEAYSIQ